MRLLIFTTCVFLASLIVANAQTLQKKGDSYQLRFESADPEVAHNSANLFAQGVGDVLKSSYPSRVLEPSVNLSVSMTDGKKTYHLVWSCRVVKASIQDADYYFDRRGTMMSGLTPEIARRNVDLELEKSNKVNIARRAIRGARIFPGFIKDSLSGSGSQYWYIREFFLVAPK